MALRSLCKCRTKLLAVMKTCIALASIVLRVIGVNKSAREYGLASSSIMFLLVTLVFATNPISASPSAITSGTDIENDKNYLLNHRVGATPSRLRYRNRSLESDNLSRIVGGENAPIGMYPHQVQILYAGYFVCGGALVARDLVICAAHCTAYAQSVAVGRYVNPNKVSTGSGTNNNPEQVISICNAETANHDLYGVPGYGNSFDIALYKLCSPVTIFDKKDFITLNASQTQFSRPLTVTGWGALSQGGSAASVLQEVQVDFIPNSVCGGDQTVYSPQSIHADMLCAGVLGAGGKDACQGDSGGPLMVADKTFSPQTLGYNPHLLIGIVSWGAGCAQSNAPGVYARISYFKNWLDNKALAISPNYGSQLKWSYNGQVSAPNHIGGNNVVLDSGFTAKLEETVAPSQLPTSLPSLRPSSFPSAVPSFHPSIYSANPSVSPSQSPSAQPSSSPTEKPSDFPSMAPSASQEPSITTTPSVSAGPSSYPSLDPSFSAARIVDPSVVVTITIGQSLTTPGDPSSGVAPISYVTSFELLQHTFSNGCVDRVDPFFGQNGYMRYCNWIEQVSGSITSPTERSAKVDSRCAQYGTICPVTCGFCTQLQ